MITLNASGGSITFEFSGNSTYLNDGTITVPVNSLALIIDESNMATFKKAASNDIFVSANVSEFGMTKAELESWFKENAVGSTGGGGTDTGTVQTMIDESISGKADSSAVTEEISAAVSGKANISYVNQRLSGKVDNIISTGERVDVLLTGASSLDNWPLIVGYDYVLIPDSIYNVYGWGTSGVYDFSSVDGGYLYINANYTTSGDQEEYESIDGKFRLPVADIDTTKVNRIYTNPDGITVTLVKEGNDINATEEIKKISGKQDTLSAGTGIEISGNVISATGGGSSNLPISAGTGTNSVIVGASWNVASNSYSYAEGSSTTASGKYAHAEGSGTKASGTTSHAEGNGTSATTEDAHAEGNSTLASGRKSHAEGHATSATSNSSHAEGYYTLANGSNSHAEGSNTQAYNMSEHASGEYNVSNTGESTSAQTLFSVGNGGYDETAQDYIRHNAFEIRKNGDIYFFDGTNDVKLQDVISNILNRLTTIENNS